MEVLYLYSIFESYVRRHVAEIQQTKGKEPDILDKIKKNRSFARVVELYFAEHAKWPSLKSQRWDELDELTCVRNCIAHSGGVVLKSKQNQKIYNLERRLWKGQPVGLSILRINGNDIGEPIIIDPPFLEYCLDLLEAFFRDLAEASNGKYNAPKAVIN